MEEEFNKCKADDESHREYMMNLHNDIEKKDKETEDLNKINKELQRKIKVSIDRPRIIEVQKGTIFKSLVKVINI